MKNINVGGRGEERKRRRKTRLMEDLNAKDNEKEERKT